MASYVPYFVQQTQNDSISSIAWCHSQDFLASGAWDGEVRVWEVQTSGKNFQTQPLHSYSHEAPVLCIDFTADGKVLSGGCDNQVLCFDCGSSGPASVVAKHEAPIRSVFYVEENSFLITCGWDNKICYWDMRSEAPIGSVDLPGRVFCAAYRNGLLAVGVGPLQVAVYDVNNPSQVYKVFDSTLKYQTRCLGVCSQGPSGFAMGSVEGRVSVRYVDDMAAKDNDFAFKAHRVNNDVYAVNSIDFHPRFGTFATTGADGTYCFWDKDSRQRLRAFTCPKQNFPIVQGAFNSTGNIYAIASAYDWSKGPHFAKKDTAIYLHAVEEDQIRARPRVATTKRK